MDEILKKLEITHSIREFHHRALWEEEKHFAWWVSIILSAQILIFTSDFCRQDKLALITIIAGLGVLLCVIAILVLLPERRYFNVSRDRFLAVLKEVFPQERPEKVPINVFKCFIALFVILALALISFAVSAWFML